MFIQKQFNWQKLVSTQKHLFSVINGIFSAPFLFQLCIDISFRQKVLMQSFQSQASKVLKVNVISVMHPLSLLSVPCVLLDVLKYTVVKEHRLANHLHLSKISATLQVVHLSVLLSRPTSNLSVLLGDPQKLVSPNSLFILVYCHVKFIAETSHEEDQICCHLTSHLAFQLLEDAGTVVCLQFCDVMLWKNLPYGQLLAQCLCILC